MRQQPTQEEVSHYTAASASKVFQNNMGELVDRANECETEQDMTELENHLQKLILNEMMKKNPPEQTPVQARKKRLTNMKENISNSKSIRPRSTGRFELEDRY